jgi:hypothetical protein
VLEVNAIVSKALAMGIDGTAINKRAVPAKDAGEKIIAQAEGGKHAVRWVRGNRTQVTLSMRRTFWRGSIPSPVGKI